MKLSNGEIFNAREPLQRLVAERLPVRVSYGLAKLAAKLNDQFQVIEQVRQGLIKTYGEQDKDNPNRVSVNPTSDKYPKFLAEYGELMRQEVEVVVDVVSIPYTLDIEPSVLMALDKFIKI